MPTLVTDEPEVAPEAIPSLGIITASGRYFINNPKTTSRQDTYVWTRIEEAGLEELQEQVGPDGSISELAIKIIKAAYEKDLLYDIVGALLTETNADGVPLPLIDVHGRPQRWTVAKAQELGNFVANLDDPDEKDRFNAIINATLILFFTTGVNSYLNSQNSSEEAPTVQSRENQTSTATPRADGSSADEPSALLRRVLDSGLDPSITGSGTKSSGTSPATTPTP